MITITSNGIIVPTFDELYQQWENKMKEIFGSDIYISPDSQDGQLLNAIVLSQNEMYQQLLVMYNNFYPNTANGYYLDKVCSFQGISRKEPSRSTCIVDIYASEDLYVQDCVLSDINDKLWTASDFNLKSGFNQINFTSVDYGIYVSSNEIINIISAPEGVISVENTEPCIQGILYETDSQLRSRRSSIIKSGSISSVESMTNALSQLIGVIKVRVYNNDTSITDSNGIPGHTICCVLLGGDNISIGTTILRVKSLGVGTYGNTSQQIIDPYGTAYSINYSKTQTSVLDINFQLRVLNNFNNEDLQNIVNSITTLVLDLNIGEILLYGKFLASVYTINDVNFSLTSVTFTKKKSGQTTVYQDDDVLCHYDELITIGDITYETIPN